MGIRYNTNDMSGEVPKPVVTKAGKKPVAKPAEVKKTGLFSRSKKQNAAKTKKPPADKKKLSRADRKRAKAAQKKTKQATVTSKPEVKGTTRQPKTTKKSSSKRVTRHRRGRLPKKAKLFMGAGVVALMAFIAYSIANPSAITKISSDNTESGLLGDTNVVAVDPDFDTLNPSSEDADKRYDPERGFSSFRDELNGKLITVNQQPVPANFELSADILLAQTEYSSIGRLETNNGSVYIARADTGAQHAIAFKFKNLLIFITTTHEISNAEWQKYVNELN